jgi:hypothetical protein
VIVGRAAEPRGSERDPQAQQGPGLGPRGGRALVDNRVRERAVRCGISHMTMEVRWRWMGMDCYDKCGNATIVEGDRVRCELPSCRTSVGVSTGGFPTIVGSVKVRGELFGPV